MYMYIMSYTVVPLLYRTAICFADKIFCGFHGFQLPAKQIQFNAKQVLNHESFICKNLPTPAIRETFCPRKNSYTVLHLLDTDNTA